MSQADFATGMSSASLTWNLPGCFKK